ncbi:MAG: sodium:calcium antiporter, partial [Patescibacteria group bacterium]
MEIFYFAVGLALLLVGASSIVNNSLALANKVKISPLIIGITAVSIGTSLPEIAIALFGGIEKTTDIALGNIIGSNIANIGLVFGISILLNPLKIGRFKTQRNSIINGGLSLLFFIILVFNSLNIAFGTLFLILGALLIIHNVKQGFVGAAYEDKKMLKNIKTTDKSLFKIILVFIFSLLLIVIGSRLTINYGLLLADLFQVPSVIIGITAIAIGTSLPELAISVFGIIKKEDKLVVGNILGSNIFNILIGGGVLGIFTAGGLS